MTQPSIFLGLVTHGGSRYTDASGAEGLGAQLAEALAPAQLTINHEDLLSTTAVIKPRSARSALLAELRADFTWARFLGKHRMFGWWLIYGARWMKGLADLLTSRKPATVRRLLNIELSHLSLMEQGLASEAPWILILEDDAMCGDVNDLANGLLGIMRSANPPAFANLSTSFDIGELRIDHLLSPATDDWRGSQTREIWAAERPVTNTVCAILYRRDFLLVLVHVLKEMPLEPVVPIDWKLNLALITLFETGAISTHECWMIEPGPIVQRSLHEVGSQVQ